MVIYLDCIAKQKYSTKDVHASAGKLHDSNEDGDGDQIKEVKMVVDGEEDEEEKLERKDDAAGLKKEEGPATYA